VQAFVVNIVAMAQSSGGGHATARVAAFSSPTSLALGEMQPLWQRVHVMHEMSSPVLTEHCLVQPGEAAPFQCDICQAVQQGAHLTAPTSQQLCGCVAGSCKADRLEPLQDTLGGKQTRSIESGRSTAKRQSTSNR
jgi:hypothetical protein